MGLLTTVIKKPETNQKPVTSGIPANDDRKILLNINSRMDELKNQNLENAKFLRGISRKIETELSQMREMEENKSIEVYDDTELVASINRVEQSLLEINNNEILDAIDRVSASLNEINSSEVMDSIGQLNKSLGEMKQDGVMEEVIKVGEAVERINNDDILIELRRVHEVVKNMDFGALILELDAIKATITDANPEVVLIEIDKINKALKDINSVSVLAEVEKANFKLSQINMDEVITEIHRVETIVSDINENAVLAELDKVKQLINEKNSDMILDSLNDKIRELKVVDYSEQISMLEESIKANQAKIEELATKVDRVNTMPNMLRSVIEHSNDINLKRMEDITEESGHRTRKRVDGMRLMVNINLWVSLLTAAVLIANILGVI